MARTVPVHYLRANESEWTPACLVCLDTETRPVDQERDVQGLRCWVATRVDRPAGCSVQETRQDAHGTTGTHLAATINGWTRGRDSVWVYAHNLTFDLVVSRLPLEMAAHGWEVTDFALDGRSPWMRLSKGRKHITLADSWSWLPEALEVIGSRVDLVKPALPGVADDLDTWLARCRADVDILLAAMTQLMDWWQRSGRGRWSVTGAASGWNAFRHINSGVKVVIDPDPEAMEFDRKAIYGGKRYVNKVGNLVPGAYVEADFAKAYTVIARDMQLPTRRMLAFDSLSLDDPRIDRDGWGVIAECEIESDRPIFPKRDGGRVWYPIGRYRTILASPEIIQARDRGYLKSIGSGRTYRTGPVMRAWAQWCLNLINGSGDDVPDVARVAARQWGRSVVGKWAQRKFTHIKLGYAPTEGWGYSDLWVGGTHARGSIVDMGGQRYMCYPDGDGENAFPAVLAFVESHVRARLNIAIDAIGHTSFVQCDTDGILLSGVELMARIRHAATFDAIRNRTDDPVNVIMERVSELTAPLQLRVKARYRRVEVIGPQHIRLDGARRFSGIPAKGEELENGWIGAWTWPRLGYQMARGDQRGYVREYQRYRVPRSLASGWVTTTGDVLPVEYGEQPGKGSVALPWDMTRWHAGGYHLAAEQNRSLLALVSENGR